MDKSTAGGLGGGWALVALAIILGGVGFGPYIDVPSVIIVIGGTIAVTAGQFEASDLKRVTPAIKVAFNEVFQLLVDGTKAEVLTPLLETKLEHMSKRHGRMIAMFGNIGGTAGAMGMIGTLVGLVAMLANLSDPAAVGPAMAVALLTTMYGALVGTLFAGIMESKLAQKHDKEVVACEVIILGSSMIAAEESIGNIKMQLNSILTDVEE